MSQRTRAASPDPESADRTVTGLVHDVARRTPDAVAVRHGDERVSYAELLRRAGGITTALRARGVSSGDSVAVRLGAGPWQVAAMLGVFGAGASLLCVRAHEVGRPGSESLGGLKPAALLVDRAPADDDLARWFTAEFGGELLDVTTTRPAAAAHPPGTADERAYVAFTSGSTGTPKGIPMTHAALAQLVGWFASEFGVAAGSRVAQWAAPGYDAALVETFVPLIAGGTLCPVPTSIRANPDKVAAWLADQDITVFQTVPSFVRTLVKVLRETGRRPPLRTLLLAGEVLPERLAHEIHDALSGVRLVNLYGPTECLLATWCDIPEGLRGAAPIGRPIPGRRVLVLGERDRPCEPGETGEIVIGSPYVTSGYLGYSGTGAFRSPAPEGTALPGRWYRTGDRGRFRADGLLEFAGRDDTQVKLLGTRLELGEVEAVLLTHPGVTDCAVLAHDDPGGLVARLTAYVVGKGELTAATLRAHLRGRFGKDLVAVRIRWLPELPRNLGGKVDRRALAGT